MSYPIVLEMAEALPKTCHSQLVDALAMLSRDGDCKTFHAWGLDDLLEIADAEGKPILREDAIELLETLFDEHSSSKEISWPAIEAAVRAYHLDFFSIRAGKDSKVHGVFKVWSEHEPIAHQFGLFPRKADGNFPAAFDFAWWFAQEMYGRMVFVSCESSTGVETSPWFSVQYRNGETTITESER